MFNNSIEAREDLILKAWEKIGCPELTEEIINLISIASGQTVKNIEKSINKRRKKYNND